MIIAVYPKTGTIAQGRFVRFTGVESKEGLYEVELVGTARRAHAIVLPIPGGVISSASPGNANTLGDIVEGEAAGAFGVDDDLTPESDGRVKKSAKGDRRCAAVSISVGVMGKPCKMLLRWATRP